MPYCYAEERKKGAEQEGGTEVGKKEVDFTVMAAVPRSYSSRRGLQPKYLTLFSTCSEYLRPSPLCL